MKIKMQKMFDFIKMIKNDFCFLFCLFFILFWEVKILWGL